MATVRFIAVVDGLQYDNANIVTLRRAMIIIYFILFFTSYFSRIRFLTESGIIKVKAVHHLKKENATGGMLSVTPRAII